MSHPIYVRDERFDSPCPICGKGELRIVAISYDAQKKYEGRLHRFHISNLNVKKCESCGELFFDAASHEQIAQGLRGKLKLLSPSDIRQQMARFQWNQKQLAGRLRSTPETISRWLSGANIQSSAMDEAMRNVFALAEIRQPQANVYAHEVIMPLGELGTWTCSPILLEQQAQFPQIQDDASSGFSIDVSSSEMCCGTERGPPENSDLLLPTRRIAA